MRWFKHLADARNNPKIRRVVQRLGEAGYARFFRLLEVVADRGGSGPKFRPELNLNDAATDLAWLASEMGCESDKDAKETLDLFAAIRLIDPKAWKRGKIRIPQMTEYKDEWASRNKKPVSVETPERLRSNSRATQVQSQKSESRQSQKEMESKNAAAQDEFFAKLREVSGKKAM